MRGRPLALRLVVRQEPSPEVCADAMAAVVRQVWAKQAREQRETRQRATPTPTDRDGDDRP